jgi:cytochrome P450
LRTNLVEDPLSYKNKEQYQFVATTKEFMGFGYGRHACPGRFFAANEIKLIIARLLLDFDIRMPDGVTEPYKPIRNGLDQRPDPSKMIMLRRAGKAEVVG